MTQEQIIAQLADKKITNPYQNYIGDLKAVFDAPTDKGFLGKLKSIFSDKQEKTLLTKHNAEIGLLLLNAVKETEDKAQGVKSYQVGVAYKSKRYDRLEELLGTETWNDPAHYHLLIYFFGDEKAAYVKHAWEQVPFQMYQQGYERRSFRAPQNKELYFKIQVNFLIAIIGQSYINQYDHLYNPVYTYYNLSTVEQIKYAHGLSSGNPALFRLWSAAIDLGNQAALQQAEDIIFNKDEEGKVTTSIIKALLNSNKLEAWQLVEKLLLAAQRQEGLRQSILESLDETSIGGLKYMIKVILDNNLARFSSVVRAVDVWAGLGWESERETTVRNFLQSAQLYLENPDQIPAAIQSMNNMDVYMALWAQGVYDVKKTLPYLEQLLQTGDAEKRCLALLFAYQTHHYQINMPLFYKALDDADFLALGTAVTFTKYEVCASQANYYNTYYPELFNKLNQLYKRTTIKEKFFSGVVFSWFKVSFEKKEILQTMNHLVDGNQERVELMLSYFTDMDSGLKYQLSRLILPIHSEYNYRIEHAKSTRLTDFQRKYAFLIIKDRSEFATAFKALHNVTFTKEEMDLFPDLLKRKAPEFRNKIIQLLVKQPNEILAPILEPIVLQGDVEQRLAGLDILLQLHQQKRIPSSIAAWVTAFKERKTISQKEEILLTQLSDTDNIQDVSAAYGFGLFDVQKMSPVILPAIDPNSEYEQQLAANMYGFSMPYTKIKEALADLYDLFKANKNHEYEVSNWDNSIEKVLLGNGFRRTKHYNYMEGKEETFEDYPLHEVWAAWYAKWQLLPRDLFILGLSKPVGRYGMFSDPNSQQVPFEKDLLPESYFKRFGHYDSPVFTIVHALSLLHPFEQANRFLLHACIRLFSSLDEKTLKYQEKKDHYHGARGWQQNHSLTIFLKGIDVNKLDEKDIPVLWNLYNWQQFSGLPENVADSIPPMNVFCRAYAAGVIGEDELYRGLLTPDNIRQLSEKKTHKHQFDYIKAFPFLQPIYDRIKTHLLDVELKRGDSSTPITALTSSLQIIHGVNRFAEILAGLGKTNFNRGYVSMHGGRDLNKQEMFGTLIKKCYPLELDTQAGFDEQMKKIKVEEKRLIEAAMYAPQWQKMVSSYLGWKGLDTAIWWMHAHTKTDAYQAMSAEAESEIARYSAVDVADFKEAAVDKDWFLKAYKEIGKERWPMVYDAAKYISDGNGHRRARIYADVIVGNLNLNDVTEKVKGKRDQDYLRVYGLVPLAKNNMAKDVLERYIYLEQFRKESRQFGSQKQTSEALAIRVAMENLARNAGYPDPIRLTWAMETKQVQTILSKETQVQYDDVVIGLIIDEDGLADVVAFKEEKQLKSIPPKYKKDKKVEELLGFRKTLREQYKRSRKGLEDAMVRGDVFLYKEIQDLFSHPVISKHLEKLVFVNEGLDKHGFYKDGLLVAAEKQEHTLTEKDKLRIAHCTDLYKTTSWATYQTYAFEHRLQQPFKQIFRELYLPTADELAEKTISRRYAGHQVQPKQTVALLKSRGWKVDYEEGLQKVFHKQGFMAKMYAMADWFSPADVESPTLETVQFHDLKTFKDVAFSTIEPRIFSEVMRDMDLVVSVAHVGGVDAEASHSSIEMRAVLLTETMRLFKIKNVEIKGSHAIIKGKLGEYNVHLGSAVVHQMAAGYLSILPVHSHQRGRLFLPFVDDDPKAAEVISKVLLLARDSEIQDPTILRQLG